MKIGIVTDPWKVKIFKKELTKAGYKFEFTNSKTMPVFTVEVTVTGAIELQNTVRNINNKARNSKKH